MAYERKTPKKPPTPPEEQRIGVMTPEDFEASVSVSLGGRGWQKAWCRGTGQYASTLQRYLSGAYPIPQYVAVIVEMLATLRRNNLPVPDAFGAETTTSWAPSDIGR